MSNRAFTTRRSFRPACNSLRQKVRQSVNGTGKNFMKNVFHYITNTRCFPTTNNGDHMLDTAYFFTVFFCFRSKTMGIYPPSAYCGFWICGCSRSRYGSDFLSVDNFLEKKQSGMPFTAFCLFSGKLSPVIMTKRKSDWFAAIFLFLYNKDKKEKDG